jgi:hypothetical protein
MIAAQKRKLAVCHKNRSGIGIRLLSLALRNMTMGRSWRTQKLPPEVKSP